jgi:hypothetical protein
VKMLANCDVVGFVCKATPSRHGTGEPWASAAPRLEPVWRPPRAPRCRFGGIGVEWTPQARKATPYRGGRDVDDGAHGDAGSGTEAGAVVGGRRRWIGGALEWIGEATL